MYLIWLSIGSQHNRGGVASVRSGTLRENSMALMLCAAHQRGCRPHYYMMLILAGDVESNPGPTLSDSGKDKTLHVWFYVECLTELQLTFTDTDHYGN